MRHLGLRNTSLRLLFLACFAGFRWLWPSAMRAITKVLRTR